MKPGLRYGLIALFFLAFFSAAPFIVSFVTGIKYDFKTRQFVRTGSIYAKTDPKKAQIFLNSKLAGTTPATLRFLSPGDYAIKIHKDGYFDWDKTLNVRAQYVTYANQNLNNIVLFLNHPAADLIHGGVQDFSSGRKRILYLTDSALHLADLSSAHREQTLSLPKNFSDLKIIPAQDENYYLLYDDSFAAVFDARNNRLFDISARISSLSSAGAATNGPDFQFSTNDDLYFLAKSVLYRIDWTQGSAAAVLNNVLAYRATGGNVYFLRFNPASQSTELDLSQAFGQSDAQVLIPALPNWSQAQIFLNNRSQLFILADGTFYALGGSGSLARIADSITTAQIYDFYGKILLASNNEIDLYDFFNGSLTSVTRSSQTVSNPVLLNDLGWVMFINDSRLQAIEIDNRDHQNNYTLAPAAANAKFALDSDLQKVFILNQGDLEQLTIR